MSDGIAGRQVVGIDLHLHRSVIGRIDELGNELGWVRIENDPKALARVFHGSLATPWCENAEVPVLQGKLGLVESPAHRTERHSAGEA